MDLRKVRRAVAKAINKIEAIRDKPRTDHPGLDITVQVGAALYEIKYENILAGELYQGNPELRAKALRDLDAHGKIFDWIDRFYELEESLYPVEGY
ncbi:hypothetical protein A1O7_05816 [Cladophialophora yegresii CBS 114405]|uniref:Uncharacterized protein n=1 Tax=Cladophialophora yegresii CBS 114405 TaxID=1182544 RepID=W9W1L5_9EURO|nr:uncharacterized protein A1O7_05816 [Cladophialophora yegresii CBS 114405]EXJ58391.1 hypothetical protein A1O7_05816 [Cladophialophora yegresii CBS 114405]